MIFENYIGGHLTGNYFLLPATVIIVGGPGRKRPWRMADPCQLDIGKKWHLPVSMHHWDLSCLLHSHVCDGINCISSGVSTWLKVLIQTFLDISNVKRRWSASPMAESSCKPIGRQFMKVKSPWSMCVLLVLSQGNGECSTQFHGCCWRAARETPSLIMASRLYMDRTEQKATAALSACISSRDKAHWKEEKVVSDCAISWVALKWRAQSCYNLS